MTAKSAYGKDELITCGKGELFGPGNAQLPTDNMLMLDRISHISSEGGKHGKGEIIGLLFDSNYESVAADYLFEPELTRSINVDIRYVLFLLDRVYGLEDLLSELTIR